MSKDTNKKSINNPAALPKGSKSTGKKIKPKAPMNPPSAKQGERGEYK